MAKIFGSMTEVAEVIVSPDLNTTFPPSEWVDALRWAKSFSPIWVNGYAQGKGEGGSGYTYVLKVFLVIVSIESAVVRNRDVKSPAGSVQKIRRRPWVGDDLAEVLWSFLRVW